MPMYQSRPHGQASFPEGGLAGGFSLLASRISLSWLHTVLDCQNGTDMLIWGEVHSYQIQDEFRINSGLRTNSNLCGERNNVSQGCSHSNPWNP